jgi:hypothetical protein
MIATPALCCYPPAALNGGPLDTAPPKVGEWVWQPKVDDWRAVIHTPTGTVWNQYGKLKLSSITDKFKTALRTLLEARCHLGNGEWLDVGMMENRHDMMRGCIIVFDLIEAGVPFMQRRARLRSMFPVLPYDVSRLLSETGGQVRDSVYLISQWDNKPEPIKLYTWLQQENDFIGHKFYEGLVAKRVQSLYPFGRAPKQVTPDWIKHRFDQGGQS